MGFDIQPPPLELLNLSLFFADDHRYLGIFHPGNLQSLKYLFLFIGMGPQSSFEFGDTFLPVLRDEVIHLDADELIDAHQHGLTGFPSSRIMGNEIPGNLIESFLRGNYVVISLESFSSR